ncbi:transposase [Aeromonas veronii]|uniref:Uncharacterized protein n=1 Tax=Aeromonas veronii TaxID=654 RepID=A0A4S5CD53_AERVE|nr:transposase [Aeromonas veronii]THJ40786.1 hypothetical protein E8Q35_19140 [Aeromonas veronii]HEH9428690.1 transposase [Aeromonas sobria]HEH9432694.1 transposase [Aeromonas sobria]
MVGVLVAGLYAGYRFVCTSLRLLCWAHVLRNVAVIAQSGGSVSSTLTFVG